MTEARSLSQFPVHLGLGAVAVSEPEFAGMAWYEAYATRHAADGADARLVAMHSFSSDWTSWEMHPDGEEVVVCIAGEIVLHQEDQEGRVGTVTLRAGEYAINPRGVWHTADVSGEATALFITAGWGTRHRPR